MLPFLPAKIIERVSVAFSAGRNHCAGVVAFLAGKNHCAGAGFSHAGERWREHEFSHAGDDSLTNVLVVEKIE
jgi:hypothetical protein